MTATIHSLERAKQRLRCSAKSAEHVFANAVSRGKTVEDFCGLERQYLREKSGRGCDLRVYNGFVYVIACGTDTVVTVYRMPNWFGKTSKRHKRDKQWVEEDVA